MAASLPIGVLPSTWLLQQYSLDEIFSPLIRSIKVGDFEQFTSILYGPWREWFRDLGLWILFTERLETLVWRSFIRRWYHLHKLCSCQFFNILFAATCTESTSSCLDSLRVDCANSKSDSLSSDRDSWRIFHPLRRGRYRGDVHKFDRSGYFHLCVGWRRDISKDILRWRGEYWSCQRQSHLDSPRLPK